MPVPSSRLALLSETVERLKELQQHVRRQARAGVPDADANAFRRARGCTSTTTVPFGWLYLIALERRLMRTCFNRVRSASTKQGLSNWGKGHSDAALLPLRLDHGLAFQHHFGQRRRFQRQRQLAGLDLREIQDFVDQLQQIPSRVENLVDAGRLGGRWRRGIGVDELGEAEDRIERRAQLMAHAGKEIRFREVGLFRRGLGSLQLDVILLQRLLEALALGDVARRGEHALQLPVAVVEGGRVVGHHGFLAVPWRAR